MPIGRFLRQAWLRSQEKGMSIGEESCLRDRLEVPNVFLGYNEPPSKVSNYVTRDEMAP